MQEFFQTIFIIAGIVMFLFFTMWLASVTGGWGWAFPFVAWGIWSWRNLDKPGTGARSSKPHDE